MRFSPCSLIRSERRHEASARRRVAVVGGGQERPQPQASGRVEVLGQPSRPLSRVTRLCPYCGISRLPLTAGSARVGHSTVGATGARRLAVTEPSEATRAPAHACANSRLSFRQPQSAGSSGSAPRCSFRLVSRGRLPSPARRGERRPARRPGRRDCPRVNCSSRFRSASSALVDQVRPRALLRALVRAHRLGSGAGEPERPAALGWGELRHHEPAYAQSEMLADALGRQPTP